MIKTFVKQPLCIPCSKYELKNLCKPCKMEYKKMYFDYHVVPKTEKYDVKLFTEEIVKRLDFMVRWNFLTKEAVFGQKWLCPSLYPKGVEDGHLNRLKLLATQVLMNEHGKNNAHVKTLPQWLNLPVVFSHRRKEVIVTKTLVKR